MWVTIRAADGSVATAGYVRFVMGMGGGKELGGNSDCSICRFLWKSFQVQVVLLRSDHAVLPSQLEVNPQTICVDTAAAAANGSDGRMSGASEASEGYLSEISPSGGGGIHWEEGGSVSESLRPSVHQSAGFLGRVICAFQVLAAPIPVPLPSFVCRVSFVVSGRAIGHSHPA